MYGKNPVRKQELDPDGKLWVQEIFATVQGEGLHTGLPSIFVRLAGCNLTCEFCDTEFESAFDSPVNFMPIMHISILINRLNVQYPGCKNVVITGGEPFRQNFVPLAKHLLGLGYTVEVETAGTLWIADAADIADKIHITVSPKTRRLNPDVVAHAKAFKYIIASHMDVPLDAKGAPLPMAGNPADVFVQPLDVQDIFQQAKNVDQTVKLAKQYGWRVSVQTHKHLGVE